MVKLCDKFETNAQEMRSAYCEALIEAGRKDPKIVSINCDLSSSCGTVDFEKEFPERSFNVGIQEANGCGVAAGLSATGLIPFFHSFAAFSTRRIYDQIFISCAYAGLNVKIIGMDAGISATYNGGTHMAFEDLGIMRVMPNITILEPSDTVMIQSLVKQMAAEYGVFYMRMPRKQVPRLYRDDSQFTVGKAEIIREGSDVTVIASGMEVIEALRAAEIMEKEGISVRVVDMFTIKPIDSECVCKCAEETHGIVTAENSNIIGGLGSAVAEVLAENRPTPMQRVGARDTFGEVGQQDYLKKRFGLAAEFIVIKIRKVLSKKIDRPDFR